MALMVIVAGSAAAVVAQNVDDTNPVDPDDTNNFAEAAVEAFLDLPIDAPIAANITIGAGALILSPSQTQDPNQAQSQSQTSDNSNSNSLTNTNTNIAASTSSATNTNRISNNNTFNPVLVLSNRNIVGNVTVRSSNINSQRQLVV